MPSHGFPDAALSQIETALKQLEAAGLKFTQKLDEVANDVAAEIQIEDFSENDVMSSVLFGLSNSAVLIENAFYARFLFESSGPDEYIELVQRITQGALDIEIVSAGAIFEKPRQAASFWQFRRKAWDVRHAQFLAELPKPNAAIWHTCADPYSWFGECDQGDRSTYVLKINGRLAVMQFPFAKRPDANLFLRFNYYLASHERRRLKFFHADSESYWCAFAEPLQHHSLGALVDQTSRLLYVPTDQHISDDRRTQLIETLRNQGLRAMSTSSERVKHDPNDSARIPSAKNTLFDGRDDQKLPRRYQWIEVAGKTKVPLDLRHLRNGQRAAIACPLCKARLTERVEDSLEAFGDWCQRHFEPDPGLSLVAH